MTGFLPPAAHIRTEPIVILQQRTAAVLVRELGLDRIVAARSRDIDRDVFAELVALVHLGSSATSSVNGSSVAETDHDRGDSSSTPGGVFGTAEVARLAGGISSRAVTEACKTGRLPARKVGRGYVISEADAHDYARTRRRSG